AIAEVVHLPVVVTHLHARRPAQVHPAGSAAAARPAPARRVPASTSPHRPPPDERAATRWPARWPGPPYCSAAAPPTARTRSRLRSSRPTAAGRWGVTRQQVGRRSARLGQAPGGGRRAAGRLG